MKSGTKHNIDRAYSKGIEALNSGEYDVAASYFEGILVHNSKFVKPLAKTRDNLVIAYTCIGDSLCNSGKYQEAINKYQRALQWVHSSNPNKINDINQYISVAHNNLGDTLYDKGEYNAAIIEYKKSLKLEPESSITNANMGRSLLSIKEYNNAGKFFKKAIELDPGVADDERYKNCIKELTEKTILLAEKTLNFKKRKNLKDEGRFTKLYVSTSKNCSSRSVSP